MAPALKRILLAGDNRFNDERLLTRGLTAVLPFVQITPAERAAPPHRQRALLVVGAPTDPERIAKSRFPTGETNVGVEVLAPRITAGPLSNDLALDVFPDAYLKFGSLTQMRYKRNHQMATSGCDLALICPLDPAPSPYRRQRTHPWHAAVRSEHAGVPVLVLWDESIYGFGPRGAALLKNRRSVLIDELTEENIL